MLVSDLETNGRAPAGAKGRAVTVRRRPALDRGTHAPRAHQLIMALEPGTKLGSYSVITKIGEGGMGEVYRGRGKRSWRERCVKMLLLRA